MYLLSAVMVSARWPSAGSTGPSTRHRPPPLAVRQLEVETFAADRDPASVPATGSSADQVRTGWAPSPGPFGVVCRDLTFTYPPGLGTRYWRTST